MARGQDNDDARPANHEVEATRSALARVAVVVVMLLAGCRVSPPSGLLGLKWGDDAVAAAARLGIRCEPWDPWEGGSGFEACADRDRPVTAFGAPANARLVRLAGNLDGVQLLFGACAARRKRLRDAVVAAFDLDSHSDDPYQTWDDGSLVRLAHDGRDDTCTLTVAGPRFGKAYQSWLLAQGLGSLGGARPR